MQGVVSLEKLEDDRDLVQFLSRIQTSVFDSAESFINELVERHRNRAGNTPISPIAGLSNFQSQSTETPDLFISYAREDYNDVRDVVDRIRALGATVWFDESNLNPGEDYEELINSRIEQCKRFVPFISETTLKSGRRFFKKEWSKAIEEIQYRLGDDFIAPIILGGISKDHPAIPRPFRDTHIIATVDEDFDTKLKALIRSYR